MNKAIVKLKRVKTFVKKKDENISTVSLISIMSTDERSRDVVN